MLSVRSVPGYQTKLPDGGFFLTLARQTNNGPISLLPSCGKIRLGDLRIGKTVVTSRGYSTKRLIPDKTMKWDML